MKNAVVVGDAMIDVLVSGEVRRISPEAPVLVLEEDGIRTTLGGAGNVARNLEAQGIKTTLVAAAGVGAPGDRMHELTRCEVCLVREMGRRTTVKTRYIAGNRHLFRADRESVHPIEQATAQEIVAIARGKLQDGAVLVLSDYAKGVLTGALSQTLIDVARSFSSPVIAGPKRDLAKFRGSTVVCLNWVEFVEVLGLEPKNPEAIGTYGWEVANRFELGALVVTAGDLGAYLVERVGPTHRFPAERPRAFDVTGAGDTVLATIASWYCRGGDGQLSEAVALAMLAAGTAVAQLGTVAVPYPEPVV